MVMPVARSVGEMGVGEVVSGIVSELMVVELCR